MASLAPITVPGATAIPTQWVTSGVVTPVIASPAATAATAWVPQPIAIETQQSMPMLDALAATLLHGANASDASVMSAPITVPTAPVTSTVPDAQVLQSVASPVTEFPSTELPSTVRTSEPSADPTASRSITGALAGFASATGRAVSSVGQAAGSGVSRARRVGSELWAGIRSPRSAHVSQVPSKYNPNPAAGNKDCGPASVVMVLRLLGEKIPGAKAGATPQQLINRVRVLAGNRNNASATTNHELERALHAAGTKTTELSTGAEVRAAVKRGEPVILNGNPRHPGAYGHAFDSKQMTPFNGAHWIVVSGIDTASGKFIINDPLSKVGPVKVTAAQLEAYRGGSIGIAVAG